MKQSSRRKITLIVDKLERMGHNHIDNRSSSLFVWIEALLKEVLKNETSSKREDGRVNKVQRNRFRCEPITASKEGKGKAGV